MAAVKEKKFCPFTNSECNCGAYDVVGECPREPDVMAEDFDNTSADELRFAEMAYQLDREFYG